MSEISQQVRRLTTAIIDEKRGVYTSPEFITKEGVANALTLLMHDHEDTDNTNRAIVLGPYDGAIEFIHEHEYMPPKVKWGAKIHIKGMDGPLWASYMSDYGVDISENKLYWLLDSYQ